MTYNPYVFQVMQQEGMSEADVMSNARPATLTLAEANRYGYESIEEYADAIREYVYGC